MCQCFNPTRVTLMDFTLGLRILLMSMQIEQVWVTHQRKNQCQNCCQRYMAAKMTLNKVIEDFECYFWKSIVFWICRYNWQKSRHNNNQEQDSCSFLVCSAENRRDKPWYDEQAVQHMPYNNISKWCKESSQVTNKS
jgi:hypothetical protein